MVRYSVILCNNKGKYLICGNETNNEYEYEFPGELLSNDVVMLFNSDYFFIHAIKQRIGLLIDDLNPIETFYYLDYPFGVIDDENRHCIFIAKVLSGNLKKGIYKKYAWASIAELSNYKLNIFGKQVYTKIKECSYCISLKQKQKDLDDFFYNYFKNDEQIMILNSWNENISNDLSRILIERELTHLRALLIENPRNKYNITVQNYFKLYGRHDLVDEIEQFLLFDIGDGWNLKNIIKTVVDEKIAHYDCPTFKSSEAYHWCIETFSKTGLLPIDKFIPLLEGFIMSLITEMWYDAGELGVLMSNRNEIQKKPIREYRDNCKWSIISNLKNAIKNNTI